MCFLLASALSGANMVGGVGNMGNCLAMSSEEILLQCGVIEIVEYLSRGIDASEKKLAMDAIRAQGCGGSFIMEDLTRQLLREDEFFNSGYVDLSGSVDHVKTNSYTRAHEKIQAILSVHKPRPNKEVADAVKAYVSAKHNAKGISGS
jgi:trimethylamine:corrinoid methyltransferase-like protein